MDLRLSGAQQGSSDHRMSALAAYERMAGVWDDSR
jgi:hypothetical protein